MAGLDILVSTTQPMMVLSQIISIYAYDGQRNLNKQKQKINFESCIYMSKKKKNKIPIYSSGASKKNTKNLNI